MADGVICRLRSDPGVVFAASELKRYVRKATGDDLRIRSAKAYDPKTPGLWLGLFSDFPGAIPPPASENPFDDEILVQTGKKGGLIAGASARSVLLAAYRFLTELGFRWVRPGRDGEVIPSLRGLKPVKLHETASYRHRAVCIEGAVSYEHVRDLVDWLPKVGMNGYFIQFREAYNFFQRWYEHEFNPVLKKETFSLERARELTQRVCGDIKKRGLLLHMVGHGWTCEPFGITGTGWYQHGEKVPQRTRKFLAEVNGKRELWGDIALNTNLCYGNDKVRQTVTDAIVTYAKEHSEVDILHFWLADGSNNHCECPLCRDERPADVYVRMLNELDVKLSDQNLDTKIVFLIYVDLLWPPQKERIANPDRFILMFAPITRSYSTSFAASRGRATLPPFKRNELEFPRDPRVNLAFLRGWQKMFKGDSFDFDYHFMWDHYRDPAQYSIAEVLHEDIRSLKDIGLAGLNSCQVQRAFFPTGLGMTTLGRTLWDSGITFDEVADDYFQAAFGRNGRRVREYLCELSALFNPPVLREELSDAEKAAAFGKYDEIPRLVRKFKPIIARGTKLPVPAQARSWRYLEYHAELCVLLSDALRKRALDDSESARKSALAVVDWARRHERRLHRVLDVALFLRVFMWMTELTPEDIARE